MFSNKFLHLIAVSLAFYATNVNAEWRVVGTVAKGINLQNVSKCELRLKFTYPLAEGLKESRDLYLHQIAASHGPNLPGGDDVENIQFTASYSLLNRIFLSGGTRGLSFDFYKSKVLDPIEKPFDTHISLRLPNRSDQDLTFEYYFISSNTGSITNVSNQLDDTKFVLEKNCSLRSR